MYFLSFANRIVTILILASFMADCKPYLEAYFSQVKCNAMGSVRLNAIKIAVTLKINYDKKAWPGYAFFNDKFIKKV